MKVCVTGGAGFIGSHLTDRLLMEGYEVVVIDNLSTGIREHVHPKARFIEMDIRDEALLTLFQEEAFDYVFHEAAQTMVDASVKDPMYDADVNILGLLSVLEACKASGVKKILVPSSAAVYGNLETLPLVEENKGEPSSFYGLTKLAGEAYLTLYKGLFGLNYVCYRYANVYGPRQGNGGEGGVVSIFAKKLAQGDDITIFGSGKQTRDFIYVDDVVEANLCGLQEEVTGVFNVSTEQATSIETLARLLCEASKRPVSIYYGAVREGDIMHSLLSTQKAKKELHWEAKTPLKEGLQKTYAYFLQEAKG